MTEPDRSKPRIPGTCTYESQQLARRLMELVERDDYSCVPYSELSRIADTDVTDGRGRSYLATARRICERETGRLVDVVVGEGVKLLTVDEQAVLAPDTIKRLKRMTRRRADRLARVQFDKLNGEQKRDHNIVASTIGAIRLFLKPSSQKQLGSAVEKSQKKLDYSETLDLFRD